VHCLGAKPQTHQVQSMATNDSAATTNDAKGLYGVVTPVTWNGKKAVRKRSNGVDYTMELEYYIGKKLNKLNCPHFARVYGFLPEADGIHSLVFERIEGPTASEWYDNHVNDDDFDEIMLSIDGRVLIAAAIIDEQYGIVHNDLHLNNIIMASTDADVCVYLFPDGKEYAFLTYWLVPVLIDFGLAFPGTASKRMLSSPIDQSMAYFPVKPSMKASIKTALRCRMGPSAAHHRVVAREMVRCFGPDQCINNSTTSSSEGTFPDAFELIRAVLPNATNGFMDICCSNVKLPLDPRLSKSVNLPAWFDELGQLVSKPIDVKNIWDGRIDLLSKPMKTATIRKVRRLMKKIIRGITPIVALTSTECFEALKQLPTVCEFESVRKAAEELHLLPISYYPRQSIEIYSVADRRSFRMRLSETHAKMLNDNSTTFKALLKQC
jgi:hypothetical protein